MSVVETLRNPTLLCIGLLLGSTPSLPASSADAAPASAADQEPQEDVAIQRARFLSRKYLEQARELQLTGDLEQSKALLLRAKEFAPADEEILSALASVQAQLGETAGATRTYAEQMEQLWKVREERARAEVTGLLQKGRQAMEAEKFDEAVELLRGGQLRIQSGPSIEWGDLDERASALLTEAEDARLVYETDRQERVEGEILRQRRAQEEVERARVQKRVDGYLDTAVRAFEAGRYRLAQDLAYEAMKVDPTSHIARDIHNTSTKALRESRADRYVQEKRREYLKLLEATEDLRIPQSDILRTDPLTWEIATKRVGKSLPAVMLDPDDKAVRDQVQANMVPKLSFTEENGEYTDVVKLLRTVTGIPVIITPEARTVISDESLLMEIEIVAPLSVSNFLDEMVGRSENLAWTVRNGVVEITSKMASGGNSVLVSHDIRDLVFPRTEFLPPVIRDLPAGDTFGESGPRVGSESDETTPFVEPDVLQQNIKGATGGETYWDTEGGGTMEFADAGYLLVYANPEMQRTVEGFLNDARRFATSVVTIETKFLTITQNFLQEIGVDFRGLGGAGNKGTVATLDDVTNKLVNNASRGFDNQGTGEDAANPSSGAFFNDGQDGDIRGRTENFFTSTLGKALSTSGGATAAISILDDLEVQILIRAIEKEENIQVVNSQLVTVLNNERANMAVINQTSYVRDFDVEVAQASFIADPKVDVIQDGIVLDVRPTIAHDRKHVMLSLQPTVALLNRPIPTFTTSLAGATLPVTLQLPQLTVRSFATTASVPDGGSVLIGGLRELLQKERRAQVPLFAHIPIIGFLFKQEGVADENSSLAVLVTATITDVKALLGVR